MSDNELGVGETECLVHRVSKFDVPEPSQLVKVIPYTLWASTDWAATQRKKRATHLDRESTEILEQCKLDRREILNQASEIHGMITKETESIRQSAIKSSKLMTAMLDRYDELTDVQVKASITSIDNEVGKYRGNVTAVETHIQEFNALLPKWRRVENASRRATDATVDENKHLRAQLRDLTAAFER